MADFNRRFSRIKLEIVFLCEKNTKNNCCIQTFFPWEGFFTLVGRGRKAEHRGVHEEKKVQNILGRQVDVCEEEELSPQIHY